jgi:N-methylhydantoinase B
LTTSATDPFTREIIKESLVAATEESFVALGRASKSTIIYEVLDYACGLTDSRGDLVAQANGVPGFLGLLTFCVREVLEKYGKGRLSEGDIILSNVPYASGTHLSDVAMCMPIFHEGELIAFSVNKAHWTEVGGKDPGSWTTDTTEIYQEGLQFPAVKLYEQGIVNESLVDVIRANVRLPDMSLGDMHAQTASLRVAAGRVHEIVRKHGWPHVQGVINWYLNYGEAIARQHLSKLPKGEFTAEDWIDESGVAEGPIRVRVRVTIETDRMIIDYAGTAPQTRGPVNCTLPATICAARKAFLGVVDPRAAVNEGCFRPLEVLVPEGSVFNAQRPAPTATYWDSMIFVEDLVWKALAPHLPGRLSAGHFLSTCGLMLSARQRDGRPVILVEPQAGGWGAGYSKDGERGLVASSDGDTYMIPIEVCEHRFPIRVEQYGFNTEPGGQGEFRGGNGLIRDYRILGEEASLTATFGRFRSPPWGVAGGSPGTCNRLELRGPGDVAFSTRGKVARFPLVQGHLARLVTGIGGGYGDPFRRDPERVLEDVLNDFVSEAEAARAYGVVVARGNVDFERTAELRATHLASRQGES